MTDEDQLSKLLDSAMDDHRVDLGSGISEGPPPSKHALVVDSWTEARAEELVDADWNLNEDGFTHRHSEREIADAFAASFEYAPKVDPGCVDVLRRRWYESLLKSQKFQELHISTCGDDFLAEIAAAQLSHQYGDYVAGMTEEEQEEAAGEGSLSGDLARHRSIEKAVKDASQQVQDANDVADAFGLGKGSGAALDKSAMAKLFVAAKSNETLRRIAELAGRYRRLAQSLQNSKPTHGMDDMVGIEFGSDLSRLTVGEMSNFMCPELHLDTLRRIVEGEAHCREYQSVAQENRGPIMVLVDESGSMDGDPIAEAKAMALSLAWLAKHQNRWCCLVGWSSVGEVRELVLPPGKQDQAAIIDWCGEMFEGGTYPPVDRIHELFLKTGAPEGKTDLIWITDGDCSLEAKHVEQFNEFRRQHSVRSFTLGIGGDPRGFYEISDEVKVVPSLTADCEVVEQILSI